MDHGVGELFSELTAGGEHVVGWFAFGFDGLAELLAQRNALLVIVEQLAAAIAAAIREVAEAEVQAGDKRPAPDWEETLPAGLSAVCRKQEAESNVV